MRLSTDHPTAGMDDEDCVDDHRKSFVGAGLNRGAERKIPSSIVVWGGSRVGIGCDEVHPAQLSLQVPGCRRL